MQRKTDTAYIVEGGLVCAEENRHCLYSGEWAGVCVEENIHCLYSGEWNSVFGGKQALVI